MPELPEVTAYVEGLERLLEGRTLRTVRLRTPSLLRSWDPPLSAVDGRVVQGFGRIGKRVVWHLEDDLHIVVHLMVTGRFHWKAPGARIPRKTGHAAFDFEHGTMLLTEMSTHKRASLHVVRGSSGLDALDPGGLDPLEVGPEVFAATLTEENRTLKRALTDPRVFSGIGNAHSDEILHRAGLSPLQRTRNLSHAEVERLREAVRAELTEWIERLRREYGSDFPEKVTAFHPAMAVHGRYGEPCPVCGSPVQRVKYADRETNYCAPCQTGGKVLADRGLSRLLGDDWPRTLEELEELRRK